MDERKFLWSKDETLKLIKLYKSFPFLWNPNLPDNRDRGKRANAINKIAKVFNITAPEIQRKLHNLRCSFNQEIRRVKEKETPSSWEYFESMYFVADQHKRRKLVPIPKSLELRSFKTEDPSKEENNRTTVEDKSTLNTIFPERKRKFSSMTEETEYPTNRISHVARPYDDYQMFGNFVGAELRGLSCPYKRDDLKRMILQNILTVTDFNYVSPSLKHFHTSDQPPSMHNIISVETINDLEAFDATCDQQIVLNLKEEIVDT